MGKRVWRRDAAKERFWRRTMREHRRSRLTIREFCSRRSLREPQFYAWRRELARRDVRAARKASPSAGPAPRFVSLQLSPEPPAPAMIEVVTRNGHTLRVPCGADRQTLAEVWALLEDRPC
jgi:hypothetical protein